MSSKKVSPRFEFPRGGKLITAAFVLLILSLVAGAGAAGPDGDGKRKVFVVSEDDHSVREIVIESDVEEGRKVIIAGSGEHRLHEIHIGEGDEDGNVVWIGSPGHHGDGGFLGVHLTELSDELRTHFGAPENAGVMVSRVVDDSPAARAGLQVGDIITRVNGEDVGSTGELQRLISRHEDGEMADLEIFRDGGVELISATLEARKNEFIRIHRGLEDGARVIEMLCEESEDCAARIECDNGDCTCSKNGEDVDCEDLEGLDFGGDHGVHMERLHRHMEKLHRQ